MVNKLTDPYTMLIFQTTWLTIDEMRYLVVNTNFIWSQKPILATQLFTLIVAQVIHYS
jgi:hypothetical protein